MKNLLTEGKQLSALFTASGDSAEWFRLGSRKCQSIEVVLEPGPACMLPWILVTLTDGTQSMWNGQLIHGFEFKTEESPTYD